MTSSFVCELPWNIFLPIPQQSIIAIDSVGSMLLLLLFTIVRGMGDTPRMSVPDLVLSVLVIGRF